MQLYKSKMHKKKVKASYPVNRFLKMLLFFMFTKSTELLIRSRSIKKSRIDFKNPQALLEARV